VRLVVSSEQEVINESPAELPVVEMVTVPNVTHITLKNARTLIKKKGLVVGSEKPKEDPERGAYVVLDQDPNAHTEVAKGTKVNLVYVAPEPE
jgi:beta-lactam-binding protein with PASTA domain